MSSKYRFSGYASIYNFTDHKGDVVLHGAFNSDGSAKIIGLPVFLEHKPSQKIGTVEEYVLDSKGLYVAGTLEIPENLHRIISHSFLSIGFYAKKYYTSAMGIRYLREIELAEISFVARPANNKSLVIRIERVNSK